MKKIINSALENEIINLYKNKVSLRKISLKVGKSTSLISRILQEQNHYIYNDNKNSIIVQKYENEPGYKWIAECKKTKITFDDIDNLSGKITIHILNTYPDYNIPSAFKRRQIEKKTGKYWYQDFFNILKIEDEAFKKNKKKCPYCDWTTIDLKNKSGAFTSHLKDIHNKNILEYTQEYPDEKILFTTFFKKINNYLNTISKKENFIECKLCNKKMKKISNTHLLNKHNITLQDYRIKFGTTTSQNTHLILKNNYNKVLKSYPNTYTSKGQIELSNFIQSLGFDIENNNKKILKGTELDIVIKNTNICIEYNGLLYHSEKYGKKDRLFHLNKTILANNNKLVLIHIFEDEWRDKKEIIKSKISHLLKKTQFNIHARKCIIRPIQQPEKELFLKSNHILGNCLSNIYYGAYFNNDLVAVMTFNNKRNMTDRHNNLDEYELTRFAIKLNHKICGISKKIIKKFIDDYKPKKIISFAERTWTNDDKNNVYIQMGFKMVKIIKPDYKYFSRKVHLPVKIHKFNFGKSSLRKKFPHLYDNLKTEWEMMQELGYDRIWDCGKWKYELEISSS